MHRLLIKNAQQIVQVCAAGERLLCGEQTKAVAILENTGNGLSMVVSNDGKITAIGTNDEISQQYSPSDFEKVIDAKGKSVLPGLIDGHTHPVWVGDRVHEFAAKLAGVSYMKIHKEGGGIHFTVRHVKEATEEELYQSLMQRLKAMLRCGTTTIEAKSGYGLDVTNEIKMLRVLNRAQKEYPQLDISCTYCGAHAIPVGKTMDEATEDVINVQIPEIKRLMDSGKLNVDNIDVFCEDGVFDTNSTRKILEAGQSIGLNVNFHGDELHPMKSGELGAQINARAISHLEEVSDDGISGMAERSVVAVLLPTTAYILKLKPPPARKMIDEGVPVALGSDFNPNAFCYSMPMVMHMACCILRMSMTEALIGATINAAASIGLSETHGSLEVGKQGDLLIIDAPKWEHLIYQFGAHSEIIDFVIKRGEVVYEKT